MLSAMILGGMMAVSEVRKSLKMDDISSAHCKIALRGFLIS
jgi:hypothetical protein